MKVILALTLGLALLQLAAAARAWGRIIEGGPHPLAGTRSLGDVLKAAQGKPVHLIYVHGMRAEGPGASEELRAAVAAALGAGTAMQAEATRTYIDLGSRPQVHVGTKLVWKDNGEWSASRPFVDRYEVRGSGGTLIVHEVNWWPLLFPLKCRFLTLPEHQLSGNDRKHLKLCARNDSPYYPWISPPKLKHVLTTRPRSGGGVWANSVLKRQILNWGLSDAVIALGPMRAYFIKTMDESFRLADEEASAEPSQEHVVVSESLGSFVVLDAYAEGAQAVRATLDRTHNLYFFANQFALLELARMKIEPAQPEAGVAADSFVPQSAPSAPSPLDALAAWGRSPSPLTALAEGPRPKQVIAFSDPSDMLTYRVPEIAPDVRVVNLYVRNTAGFLGLAADPVKAHRGHLNNRAVWKLLMRPTRHPALPPK